MPAAVTNRRPRFKLPWMRSWRAATDETLLAHAVRDRAAFAVFYERHERVGARVLRRGHAPPGARRGPDRGDVRGGAGAASRGSTPTRGDRAHVAVRDRPQRARRQRAAGPRRVRARGAGSGSTPLVLRAAARRADRGSWSPPRATRSSRRWLAELPADAGRRRCGRGCSTSASTRTSPSDLRVLGGGRAPAREPRARAAAAAT